MGDINDRPYVGLIGQERNSARNRTSSPERIVETETTVAQDMSDHSYSLFGPNSLNLVPATAQPFGEEGRDNVFARNNGFQERIHEWIDGVRDAGEDSDDSDFGDGFQLTTPVDFNEFVYGWVPANEEEFQLLWDQYMRHVWHMAYLVSARDEETHPVLILDWHIRMATQAWSSYWDSVFYWRRILSAMETLTVVVEVISQDFIFN